MNVFFGAFHPISNHSTGKIVRTSPQPHRDLTMMVGGSIPKLPAAWFQLCHSLFFITFIQDPNVVFGLFEPPTSFISRKPLDGHVQEESAP